MDKKLLKALKKHVYLRFKDNGKRNGYIPIGDHREMSEDVFLSLSKTQQDYLLANGDDIYYNEVI